MNCVKCGKSFQDDGLFCPYCGKKQAKSQRKTAGRANHTGSVYFDSRSKRWISQVVTGKHYTEDRKIRFEYKRRYFKTRTEALQAVSSMSDEKNTRPSFTVSYYYNAFLKGKGKTLSSSKQYAYGIAYKRLKPLHSTAMKDITVNDLQTIFGGVDGYYSAKDIRSILNMMFKLAAADDRSINPVLPSLTVLPENKETQVLPFTEDEQLQLWLSYEEGNMDAAIPLIMIYTGMMTGEMRQLQKDMIHLEDKEIVGVGMKTKERKKKAVLLPDDIIPVLEDVISKTETDLLYPISKDAFYRKYYKALKTAGITRALSPYSCRHTTATVLAVHENVAPQTLQRIMRWKSTKMMDRYVTPSDQDARNAINKI